MRISITVSPFSFSARAFHFCCFIVFLSFFSIMHFFRLVGTSCVLASNSTNTIDSFGYAAVAGACDSTVSVFTDLGALSSILPTAPLTSDCTHSSSCSILPSSTFWFQFFTGFSLLFCVQTKHACIARPARAPRQCAKFSGHARSV